MKRVICLLLSLARVSVCVTAMATGFDTLVQTIMTTNPPQEMSEEYYVQFTRNGELMSTNVMSCKGYKVFKSSPVERYELACTFEAGDTSFELELPGEIQAGDEFRITYENLLPGFTLTVLGNGFDEDFVVYGLNTDFNNFYSEEDYLHFSILSMEETADGMMIEASFDARLLDGEVIYTDGSFRALFP